MRKTIVKMPIFQSRNLKKKKHFDVKLNKNNKRKHEQQHNRNTTLNSKVIFTFKIKCYLLKPCVNYKTNMFLTFNLLF